MILIVNGVETEADDGVSVSQLLTDAAPGSAERGVAVAVDGEVVPRSQWPGRRLCAGERVEILVAVQGG